MTTTEHDAKKRGRRGPYAKSELTRRAILDAALTVFAQNGYRRGSLKSVAELVGISEAGLLHHFKNKSDLLAAVLDRRDDQARELFNLDDKDGHQLLLSLVALTQYNSTVPGVVELFCTLSAEATSPDHPAHAYFINRYEYSTSLIGGGLQDLYDRGQLVPGILPASASRTIVALMDGLQIQWLLDRDSVDMVDELRTYLRSILAIEL